MNLYNADYALGTGLHFTGPIWKNFGLGINQMSFNNTSAKNILYEMNSSSLDLAYTLFIKDF